MLPAACGSMRRSCRRLTPRQRQATPSRQRRHKPVGARPGRTGPGPDGRPNHCDALGRGRRADPPGCAAKPVAVVRCGSTPDTQPHGPAHAPGRFPRLVSLGRLVRRKGVDEANPALTEVPDAEPVVAGGAGAAIPTSGAYARRGRRRGGRSVRFIGSVPRLRCPRRCARPTLSSACRGTSRPGWSRSRRWHAGDRRGERGGRLNDTVADGVTGLLAPPRRPRETGAALRRVLSMPGTARAMGVAGRDRAEKRYGWRLVAAATADIYADVADLDALPLIGTAQ